MVKGLDLFRKHFKNFAGQYMLIGGTACTVLMEEAEMEFRLTRDLDIVLCAEALTGDFFKAFWAFIQAGGYEVRQKGDGTPKLYRFSKPSNASFPYMLEIFSRRPDFIIADDAHLAPIPAGDEAYSLSGILLDDAYYKFICDGTRTIDGITVVEPGHLIPLKAKAYLDLRQRKADGEAVDRKTVTKHLFDVFRLLLLAAVAPKIKLPGTMLEDIEAFAAIARDANPPLRDVGITRLSLDEFLYNLLLMYE